MGNKKPPKEPDDNDRRISEPNFHPDMDPKLVPFERDKKAPPAKGKSSKPDPQNVRPESQAKVLIDLAESHGVELFRSAGTVYAAADIGPRRATMLIQSSEFGALLLRWLYDAGQHTASELTIKQAQQSLAARAQYGGQERSVFVRVGRAGDAVYLDLGDDTGRAVETTAKGWQIIDRPPVHFVRSLSMRALPVPVLGGDLADLFLVFGLPAEQRPLLLAWLVAALRPSGPFPVLAVHGEQGSGKSTVSRLVRALFDPHEADLRGPPPDDRTLYISTRHSWVLGYDNLSTIPRWLSDALCCIATGGAYASRRMYSDDGEMLFRAQRPILLNGIEEIATRPDLLERCIVLSLPTIPEEHRRPEDALWRQYREMQPRLLGALLNAVVCALQELPNVRLPRAPRMVDFAMWATAAEPALGLQSGEFLTSYFANLQAAADLPLEASPIVAPLRVLLDKQQRTLDGQGPCWTGTATALLRELRACDKAEDNRPPDWPRNGQALSGQLKRLAPNLRQKGIQVNFDRQTDSKRTRTISVRSDP